MRRGVLRGAEGGSATVGLVETVVGLRDLRVSVTVVGDPEQQLGLRDGRLGDRQARPDPGQSRHRAGTGDDGVLVARCERYLIDDDVWFRAWQGGCGVQQ